MEKDKIFKELCIDFRNDYFQVAALTLEEVIEKFRERFDTEFEETAALLTTNEEKVIKEHFGWTYNALIDLIEKNGYVMFVPTAPKQNIVEEFIWRDGSERVMMDDYIDYDAVYDKLKADGKILETEDTIYALVGLVKTEEEFLEGDE